MNGDGRWSGYDSKTPNALRGMGLVHLAKNVNAINGACRKRNGTRLRLAIVPRARRQILLPPRDRRLSLAPDWQMSSGGGA